mgnify:CR=1 FL=1
MLTYVINETKIRKLIELIDCNLSLAIDEQRNTINISNKKYLNCCSIQMTASDCSTCIINNLENLNLENKKIKESSELTLIKHIMHYSGVTVALATITGTDIDLSLYKKHGFINLDSVPGTREIDSDDGGYDEYDKHILALYIDPWELGYSHPEIKELIFKDL